MKENSIRLQYSGFIMFMAKMFSVITGFVFQYMIARYTSRSEYDVWFNINDVLAYFLILAGIIPFWTMRFVARSEKGAVKTGVVANLALSLAATIVYLSLVPLIVLALGVSHYISLYLLASFQIIEFYMLNILENCLRAKKPQTLGYGAVVAETIKVFLGYILIMRLEKPLEGAIISITTSIALQLIYYLKILAEDLKHRVVWAYVKEWLKGSVANIYNVFGNQIAAFIFIFLYTYGGEGARSYYGAPSLIASITTNSTALAFALYPKLLADGKVGDITTSLKTVLMFAIPMTAGVVAAPSLYISILKPEYAKPEYAAVWYVLIILAFDALVATCSTIFGFVLYGFEKVDEKAKISFKELFKSRMFLSFSLPYAHSAITIPLSYIVLTTYTRNNAVMSAFSVAVINSTARFVMFLILYAMVHGMVKVAIPWKNIARYVFASTVMGCFLYCLHLKLQITRVHQILGVTGLAGIVYLALLMVIDRDARMLAKSAWLEVKTKFE